MFHSGKQQKTFIYLTFRLLYSIIYSKNYRKEQILKFQIYNKKAMHGV